jgi:glycosyltransferase involved in cell wall biosynthesis
VHTAHKPEIRKSQLCKGITVKELVSILIPAYNAGKWIEDTIESALLQTWSKKEIIIVDDGSIDSTLRIAKQFESKLVKVIFQENQGASAARNKALEYAQGEYIQWLDADDLLARNKIAEQMIFAENDITGLTLYSSPHGEFYWRPKKAVFFPNLLWTDLSPIEWITTKFSNNLWIIPAGWLVSRKLTEKAGPWNEQLTLDDDGEYFCRVVAASERIKFVREARSYYRQSGLAQLSRSTSNEAFQSLFLAQKLSIQHLKSLEDSEKTRRASVEYLQGLYQFLAPEQPKLLADIESLIIELGGNIKDSKVYWKLKVLDKLFGMKTSNNLVTLCRKVKFLAIVKWDELLYKTSKKWKTKDYSN